MLYLDGMDVLINEEVTSQEVEYVLEKTYQGLPDSPDMGGVMDQENSEKAVDTYDQFVGAKVFLNN